MNKTFRSCLVPHCIVYSVQQVFAQDIKSPHHLPVKTIGRRSNIIFLYTLVPIHLRVLEWGKGSENEEVFSPTDLDCRAVVPHCKRSRCQRALF